MDLVLRRYKLTDAEIVMDLVLQRYKLTDAEIAMDLMLQRYKLIPLLNLSWTWCYGDTN